MTSPFSVVQAPPREPGHCWFTKTAVGPFVDTGVDLSVARIDRGRIYISFDALREMARVAGILDEGEPQTVGLRRKQWYEEGYNNAVKEFSDGSVDRFIEHISRNSVGVVGNAAMVAPEGHLSAAGAAIPEPVVTAGVGQQVDENVDGSEQQGTESVVLEGPAGFSTSSSDDGNFRL